MLRSFRETAHVDPGFHRTVLDMDIALDFV